MAGGERMAIVIVNLVQGYDNWQNNELTTRIIAKTAWYSEFSFMLQRQVIEEHLQEWNIVSVSKPVSFSYPSYYQVIQIKART